MQHPSTFELWPDGAPYAAGDGQEDRPRLDAYPVRRSEPVGCVIVCPGGGYSGRAAHESGPIAAWLNFLGIAAFVLHYRVAPYRHPAPLEDCRRAVRHVRAHAAEYGIDPGKIGLLGFSAGGHAAAMAGIYFTDGDPAAADPIERTSSRPDALVLCYPVLSFVQYGHDGSRRNLIGESAGWDERVKLSGELAVTAETPPTFLWHTADDAGVPVENSLLFAMALRRYRIPFDLHVYESGAHGLGLAESHPEAYEWTTACANWLRRRGIAPA